MLLFFYDETETNSHILYIINYTMINNSKIMPNRRFHTVQLVAAVLFAFVSLRSIAEAKLQTVEGYKNIYGVRLFYKVIGQGDTILILHGGPGLDHSYMLPQMAELAKTHTLIFFDHRGFGRSDFRLDSAQYQLVNFIDDIEEIRKAFGLQKINLLGHSYGAQLAIHYTLRYPANVRSLILMSPASFNTRYTEAAAELQKKRFTREDSITRVKILASELYKHKDRQAYEQLYRNLFRSSFYNRAMADSLTLTLPYDFDERIAKLHYT